MTSRPHLLTRLLAGMAALMVLGATVWWKTSGSGFPARLLLPGEGQIFDSVQRSGATAPPDRRVCLVVFRGDGTVADDERSTLRWSSGQETSAAETQVTRLFTEEGTKASFRLIAIFPGPLDAPEGEPREATFRGQTRSVSLLSSDKFLQNLQTNRP